MIIFFILGITLFLFSQEKTVELVDLAETSYLQSNSIIVKNEEMKDYYILGDEIITQKISFDKIPIVVEGVKIERIDDLSTIKTEEKYTKNVILDEIGQLKYIEYREK